MKTIERAKREGIFVLHSSGGQKQHSKLIIKLLFVQKISNRLLKRFKHNCCVVAIHAVRPHSGQVEVAERLRSLLDSDVFPSQISGRTCTTVTIFAAWFLCF